MSDNKFNIDDSILLDPNSERTSNIKKILTGIAILVVLFLIVLILMKFINDSEPIQNEPLVMPSEEIIFKPKNEEKEEVAEFKKTDSIKPIEQQTPNTPQSSESAKIEVIQQEPRQFIEIVKNNTKIDNEKQEVKNEILTTKNTLKPKQENAPKFKSKPQPKPEKQKNIQQPKKQSVNKIQEESKKQSVNKIQEESKKQSVNKIQEESKKQIVKKNSFSNENLPKGNYIQVLATSDFNPNGDYAKKIVTKGYDYKIYKTIVNNKEFTKILIGPFDESSLEREIAKIRATLNKDAFVYRIK
ncbi:SPOR domain-containing protein [Campylobacter sp. FMV-PI01]|uniref:SPOR domain-containing protein n=1 Tax=Campylobacter portucalensis TaxID=2608384 RepID=A0A6L5WIT7_9BACT|nr:SPOR domain-containing protein [Campylobacter portucalensis]MSN95631.1 SPOR domain-containing protein [Campylobacter portucalensis]